MTRITLTLTVEFDEVENIEAEAYALEASIQNRIFGEGVFGPYTLVDTWSVRTFIEGAAKSPGGGLDR